MSKVCRLARSHSKLACRRAPCTAGFRNRPRRKKRRQAAPRQPAQRKGQRSHQHDSAAQLARSPHPKKKAKVRNQGNQPLLPTGDPEKGSFRHEPPLSSRPPEPASLPIILQPRHRPLAGNQKPRNTMGHPVMTSQLTRRRYFGTRLLYRFLPVVLLSCVLPPFFTFLFFLSFFWLLLPLPTVFPPSPAIAEPA